MRTILGLAMAVVLASACGVLDGDEEDVMAVWDLRETHAVEAVGWPEDAGSAFEATTDEGLERILLAGDVVIEGDFRVNPAREGGLRGLPYDDQVADLAVTFEREPVPAVMERAAHYADALGIDISELRRWAAANADGQDLSPGGAMASSGEAELPDGSIVYLSTRAFANGGAVLRLTVVWPRDGEDLEAIP